MKTRFTHVTLFTLLVFAPLAHAASPPFIETFDTGDANWARSNGVPGLTHVSTGGLDGGGYVSDILDLSTNAEGDSRVTFRAQDEFNSSGNAFVGNWLSDGVRELSAIVRHDAPEPLTFFARVASPFNFPGTSAVKFIPVSPNTWTELNFEISPTNPEFVTFEGSSFAAVFSNVGHVQIGFDVPASLAGTNTPVQVDLDQVAIAVPEPSSIIALLITGCGLLAFRRRC
jgi:hypothetical protein